MSALVLVAAEARRVVTLSMRYPVELLASVALMVAAFYGVMAGATWLRLGEAGTADIAAGYLVWLLASGPLAGMAADVQAESQGGTLESLCTAECGLAALLLARALVSSLHAIAIVALAAGAIHAAHGVHLSFAWALAPSLVLLMGAACGVGMVLAGVALLCKRVQFLLVAACGVAMPLAFASQAAGASAGWQAVAAALMPMAPAMGCAKASLVDAACSPADLGLAAANSMACFAAGWAAFNALLARAQRAGGLAGR